jgi:hypothetical protein
MMGLRWALPGVLVVSGAVVSVEVLGENKAHADYNVPAPTVTVQGNQANANVTAAVLSFGPGPMSYQTAAATNLILVVKG